MAKKLTDGSASSKPQSAKAGPFAQLEGRTVAVVLRQAGQRFVFRGEGRLERDDIIGQVLRVLTDDDAPGHPELIISEREWQGRVIPDFEYGCDFCLIPDR